MILDNLPHATRYVSLHPAFGRAFDFLRRPDLPGLTPGRYPLDGDLLYVSLDEGDGRGRDGARLEAHRRYIDIQLTLVGQEQIGWRPLEWCGTSAHPYDTGRDIELFADRPAVWVPVPPGHFTIFFPSDAHAPLGGEGRIRKAIVKVALDVP